MRRFVGQNGGVEKLAGQDCPRPVAENANEVTVVTAAL